LIKTTISCDLRISAADQELILIISWAWIIKYSLEL